MNGPQDLGGEMGFGPINPQIDEPIFHHPWEARVLGMTLAMGMLGMWNIDKGRHARESLSPPDYLRWSYYQIWLTALENMMEERGLLENTANASSRNLVAVPAKNIAAILEKGGSAERASDLEPKFSIGDVVTTKKMHPSTHTRLPRYLSGMRGEIIRVYGTHVFADDSAHDTSHDRGENPQWLYSVKFSAREIWGDDKNPDDYVYADLWEPYFV